jgi:hypothetical protein
MTRHMRADKASAFNATDPLSASPSDLFTAKVKVVAVEPSEQVQRFTPADVATLPQAYRRQAIPDQVSERPRPVCAMAGWARWAEPERA